MADTGYFGAVFASRPVGAMRSMTWLLILLRLNLALQFQRLNLWRHSASDFSLSGSSVKISSGHAYAKCDILVT